MSLLVREIRPPNRILRDYLKGWEILLGCLKGCEGTTGSALKTLAAPGERERSPTRNYYRGVQSPPTREKE